MEPELRAELRDRIRQVLGAFGAGSLRAQAEKLLGVLGYESVRYREEFDSGPNRFLEFANQADHDRKIAKRPQELIRETWNRIEMVFQYTEDELSTQADLFGGERFAYDTSRADSFLFLAVDLKDGDYPRHKLAVMTRAINRPFMMPVIVFFRYRRDDGTMALTLAVIHRRAHKLDAGKDVLERATLIKDIQLAEPHRAHLDILTELALESLTREKQLRTFDTLHAAWEGVLDTEELNRSFYTKLFRWFEHAVEACSFPDDGAGEGNAERHVIRMITRILFIWFLKEKRLVPEQFFEESFADEQLKNHGTDGTDYYRAVLQNLFFATLNTPIEKRAFSRVDRSTHRDFTKYRYADLLVDRDRLMKEFETVPFVNGGLFDCLDTFEHTGGGGRRIDVFTDNVDHRKLLEVPVHIFFDPDRGLFPVLRKYKFTVEENTPLDQEVALDPELLGKTFENLLAAYNPETREHARRTTGSYYTPRVVVDYMVQEALVEHLSRIVDPYDSDREWLEERLRHLFAIDQGEGAFGGKRRQGRNPGDDDHLIHNTEIASLIDAIDRLRIIDPACGSGAFPMGILHKLVMALAKIDPRNERWKAHQLDAARKIKDPAVRRNAVRTVELAFAPERVFGDFGRKLYLIQHVIHGVDIQPIATQIAKLRFFISLIIEQPTTPDPDANFGLEPLPNLETCFVAADTLKRLDRPVQHELLSPKVQRLEADLRVHRRNWFDAHDRDAKWELRKRDRRLRSRLRGALLEDKWNESAADAVANWDAYDQNARADWFDPEWMFGLVEGFDIVIGNPPYIQLQKNASELAARYEDAAYSTFLKSGDIYVLFCERGVDLLRPELGILTYITSNSWLRAKYGKKLRRLLVERHTPLRLLEMGGEVFENTIVDSSVLIAREGGAAAQVPAVDLERLPSGVTFPDLPRNAWDEVRLSGDGPWSILSKREWAVMDKMQTVGVPLKDWEDISIYYGIKTGYNDAFIIDTSTRKRLIAEDSQSADILKPILRGQDIDRYRANWAGLWLIDNHNGYNNIPPVQVTDYPAVKKHLDQYYNTLAARHDKGITPYNLRNCAYHAEFSKRKLFWMDMSDRGRFCLSDSTVFCNDKGFILTGPSLRYLCAVLNSRLVSWLMERTGLTTGMGLVQWKKFAVEAIPIPKLSAKEERPFHRLVDTILSTKDANHSADISSHQADLDRRVYQLYGLTTREIAAVSRS